MKRKRYGNQESFTSNCHLDISADSEFDKSKMQFFPIFLQKCCLFFYISYRSETKEIPLSTTVTTSSDDALVSYDNFVQHKFRYLVVENKTETKAVTSDDCIWECLTFKTCLSLNVGSVPDDGSVWCELLFTDMFTSSRSLHENASSHHLSRWVSIFKRQYSSTDVFSFLQPVHRILHIIYYVVVFELDYWLYLTAITEKPMSQSLFFLEVRRIRCSGSLAKNAFAPLLRN